MNYPHAIYAVDVSKIELVENEVAGPPEIDGHIQLLLSFCVIVYGFAQGNLQKLYPVHRHPLIHDHCKCLHYRMVKWTRETTIKWKNILVRLYLTGQ